jgi:hypothetical protein
MLDEFNVQLAPTVPTPVLDDVKLTVPVGTFPALVVSTTVTAQKLVVLAVKEAGQTTLVEVLSRGVGVTVKSMVAG